MSQSASSSNAVSLPAALLARAGSHGGALAQRVHGQGLWKRRSWSDYAKAASLAGRALEGLGLSSGDRFAILSGNSVEWLDFAMGAIGMGVVVVPIEPTASVKEVETILTASKCKAVLVGDQRQFDKVVKEGDSGRPGMTVIVARTRGLRHLDVEGSGASVECTTTKRVLANAGSSDWESKAKACSGDQIAIELFLHGSNGELRSESLTNSQLVAEGAKAIARLNVTSSDEVLAVESFADPVELSLSFSGAVQSGMVVDVSQDEAIVMKELAAVQPTILHAPAFLLDKISLDIDRRVNSTGGLRKSLVSSALLKGKGAKPGTAKQGFALCRAAAIFWVVASMVMYRVLVEVHGGIRLLLVIGLALVLFGALAAGGHLVRPFVRKAYGLSRTRAVLQDGGELRALTNDLLPRLGLPLEHVQRDVNGFLALSTEGVVR